MLYTANVKSVHKALKLRHHKHTGKLLAHKHTSYRVLFLLMLVPIIAMALVEQAAGASDLRVSAKIPAPMPAGAPAITSPVDNATSNSSNLVVSGTCPIITPAVIIALYDGETLIGSGQCSVNGTFSLPVTLSFGKHVLVATVVTITDDVGASSSPVTVTYPEPAASTATVKPDGSLTSPGQSVFGPPVRIVASDIYVTMQSDGHAVWHGSFADGKMPYTVRIDWGDGEVNTYTTVDQAKQEYSHDYKTITTHKIIIQVTDANGGVSTLYSVAITLSLQKRSETVGAVGMGVGSSDNNGQPLSPVVTFIQKYVWQIYIGTLSGLTFLWYLEHGRHIITHAKTIGRLHHR
ncbi:MAG: hypothetical protein JWN75_920 [Candidatus Saccharibacteria bacterium]|nr:hypothetical protein [Candidatus Saccharibacteria bacterium]